MFKSAFFWAILSALVWGIAPLLEKVGLHKVHPDTGLFLPCFGVVLGAVILLIFKFNTLKEELITISPKTIFFLVSGGFLASIVAQLFFYRALKFGEVSKVVPIGAMYPLVAFVLALIFLGEKFTHAPVPHYCGTVRGYALRNPVEKEATAVKPWSFTLSNFFGLCFVLLGVALLR